MKVGTSPWGERRVEARYAFVHDRVREGASELLREEERAGVHLRIGRQLWEGIAQGQQWDLFETVDHLNQAAHVITDPAERRELVRLNARAGRQARAAGAFPAAFTYLSHGLEHLGAGAAGTGTDPWQEHYELTRSLHAEAAVAAAEAAVERVLATVAKSGVKELPVMRDPAKLAVSRLLERNVMMGAWARIRFTRSVNCRLVELVANHGVGPVSPIAYVLMADVRCGELGDVEGGRRVGELGLALIDHPGATGPNATVRTAFEVVVSGRTAHPAVVQERLCRALALDPGIRGSPHGGVLRPAELDRRASRGP